MSKLPWAWILIAVATAAVAWISFAHHPIGDFLTESDFYGGYADGARLVQRGQFDPARYGVYGPVYEWVLAVVGLLPGDLFTAGRILSIASVGGTLALWYLTIARRVGAPAGLWLIVLLVANPVFIRYGISATTDLLTVLLQAAVIFAVLGARGARAPLWAGMLTALAILARYNLVYLVPASILCMLLPTEDRRDGRGRSIALYLAGLLALLAPWTAFSLSRGFMPGSELLANYGFYESATHVQDLDPATRSAAPRSSLFETLGSGAPALLGRWALNAVEHLRRDLGELVGWPAAALAVVGALVAIRRGLWRRLLALSIFGLFAFAALAPVFYSDRYSLSTLPFYLALAAMAIAAPAATSWPRPLRFGLGPLIAAVPLALSLQASVDLQRNVENQLPREVLSAGPALAKLAPQGGRVISRKGHIGFYSGLEVLEFPRAGSIAELGAYAHERNADFLYFSWVEAFLRPEFWFLLDTAAVVPGLEVVHVTEQHPGVTYRIRSSFGAAPAWFDNDTLRQLHDARAKVKVLPDSFVWQPRMFLGMHAFHAGDWQEARAHAAEAIRVAPERTEGWLLMADALLFQNGLAEATRTFEHILSLDAGNVDARIGLGRVQLAAEEYEEAARLWRPLIESASPGVLLEMLGVFRLLGDAESVGRVEAALARSSR